MSLASYHCSTPGSSSLGSRGRTGSRSGRRCLRPGTAMALEHTGRRKFAQLVPYHVLSHKQFEKLLAVVDEERMTDEVGHDGTITGPGLDRLAMASLLLFDLGKQAQIDVRPFFQ